MVKDITGRFKFLQRYQEMLEDYIEEALSLIKAEPMIRLADEYEHIMQKREVAIGLNLFSIISPYYHRENFHSDILEVFLHPEGEHREGAKYLEAFLTFLNSLGAGLSLPEYANATVRREDGKLDLAILDESSGKAIIIENKINGARDMIRQLPRYLETVKGWGYACSKIIYLVLNRRKEPDMTGWSEEEKVEVKKRLMIIPAYNETHQDLYHGWLEKAEQIAADMDARFVLRQYREIVKKIGGNVMNKVILERFYQEMRKAENFKIALSVCTMINDLIYYRADKIVEKHKSNPEPFESVGVYRDYAAIFYLCMIKESNFSIDLVVQKELYSFQFWDRNYKEGGENPAQRLLQKMNEAGFVPEGVRMKKDFKFPDEEDQLYQYIDVFKEKLKAMVRLSLAESSE